MKFLLLVILALSFAGCNNYEKTDNVSSEENQLQQVASPKPEKTPQTFIVPGKRLGNIVLDQNFNPILDSLGKPDISNAGMGKAVNTWKHGKNLLTIYTNTQMGVEDFSRVKAIRSLSNDFKTEDNLGVSSSIDELKRYYRLDPAGKFTDNGKHYILYKTSKGIAFEVNMKQICNGVLLYSKETNPESFYNAIYPTFEKM
ncbi:hypothetical protein [Aequorivita echinoideorum]|uniref:Lipoprotein n=1 Tax=Aequorivita echinoideorum TaxID=1549647 RepID=A0ABS5S2T4_9FLAO|nr:hypothetical protein [Aequorivita echinoideorum]MBT0607520.1 hypothetical protein [Aequorivita echinoideorum]